MLSFEIFDEFLASQIEGRYILSYWTFESLDVSHYLEFDKLSLFPDFEVQLSNRTLLL